MAQKSSAPLERQVRNAMKSLAEAGKPITNESVRQTIGGGSFRDIGPLVKSIKAELAAKEQASREAPDMPDDFHDAAASMWNTAWSLADEIAASERRGHAAEIEKLRGEADEALSNCGVVEDERDAAEARAKATASILEELREALHAAQLEIANLNGRLSERDGDLVQRGKSRNAKKPKSSPEQDEEAQPDMFPEEGGQPEQSKDQETSGVE